MEKEEKPVAAWRRRLIVYGPILVVFLFLLGWDTGYVDSAVMAVLAWVVAFMGVSMCVVIVRWVAGEDLNPPDDQESFKGEPLYAGVLCCVLVWVWWQCDSRADLDYIAACAGPAMIENAIFYDGENYTEALADIDAVIRSCASEESWVDY